MSEGPHPTLEEIRLILADLSHRVASDDGPTLDPVSRIGIHRAIAELERFIPGLDPPPDADGARELVSACAAALFQGRPRIALARALRGLTYAPHHAELHYLGASACFELMAASEAVALLAHAAWINPGHEKARRELEALSAYGHEPESGSDPESEGDEDRGEMDRAA